MQPSIAIDRQKTYAAVDELEELPKEALIELVHRAKSAIVLVEEEEAEQILKSLHERQIEKLISDVPAECGALDQWQREVAAGQRSKTQVDSLWRAACLEAQARDEMKEGLRIAARTSRVKAAECVLRAAA